MRKLKAKYRKKKKTIISKLGRWCQYYSGRIPFPIECESNCVAPLNYDRPFCQKCKRNVEYIAWKSGGWDKIIIAVKNGEDLTDMDSPNNKDNK